MRREFEMNEEQVARILEASRPVPYIIVGGVSPSSPQENANRAWAALGREMGFEPMSVRPVAGKSTLFFTAEEAPPVT